MIDARGECKARAKLRAYLHVIEITNFGAVTSVSRHLRQKCALRHRTLRTCVVWRRNGARLSRGGLRMGSIAEQTLRGLAHPTERKRSARGKGFPVFLVIALLFLIAWLVAFLAFHVVFAAIHILLGLFVIFLIVHFVRAVGRRA